jgi:hypothetical protein
LELPERAVEEVQTAWSRIQPFMAAARLWERVLTEAERQRLGGDLVQAHRQYGTAGMWARLRGVSPPRAVVDVAHALNLMDEATRGWLLRELGEIHDDPEAAVNAAVESGALVLVERPREAYWDGWPINVNWERRSALWSFFWELCRAAKAGRPIDHTDLGSDAAPDAVTKQKSRLLRLAGFPVELGDLIQPVGRGTQRLVLPAASIRLFEFVTVESLRDWTP